MYVFFLDIDGTMYRGETTDKVREAIAKAQEAGHKVFINTARHHGGMPVGIRNMPLDGFVTSYGCTIFSEGDYIRRLNFTFDELAHFADYAAETGVRVNFYGEDILLGINDEDNGKRIIIKDGDELKRRYKNAKICKLAVYCGGDKAIQSHFRQYSDIFVFESNPERIYFEAVPKGQNKAEGIKFIERYYDVPHKNTIAIGDTVHDIDMIEYAGYGIAMGSGQKALIDKVEYVTETYENDGVAYAIECFLNGEEDKLKKQKEGK